MNEREELLELLLENPEFIIYVFSLANLKEDRELHHR